MRTRLMVDMGRFYGVLLVWEKTQIADNRYIKMAASVRLLPLKAHTVAPRVAINTAVS
jgi:hypothetical protein